MIQEPLVNKITSIFQTRNELFYQYLWIADIKFYYKCNIILSVVRTRTNELRGLLLVLPSKDTSEYKSSQPNITKYVNLADWKDPVNEALQSLSLLPEGEDTFSLDDPKAYYMFKLSAYSTKMITHLDYGPGHVQHPTLINLWEALKMATKDISNLYQDKDISASVEPRWK
jgi:hypothetical protein